ncbi:4-hydroxyphenylacetate decarboxylase activating enzyme [termite gut metagenome]|uniref:4-hydroxyphenylacetate decarboxylase activating enzyme n=1 Tax=termite gut metagenome TaxID=433724 RepID=A0A5J4QMK0_9ZZZZ
MTNSMEAVFVMEVERFAIHGGPVIRTVVFLRGWPLRCLWCSNPESQVIRTHLFYLSNRCIGCGKCFGVCPSVAITFDVHPVFDRGKCTMCTACVDVCPQNAIKTVGKQMTVQEILNVVRKDKEYYDNSGGGVTFSGGEPFVQFDGLMQLLSACKKDGIHTVVETGGQVTLDKIKQAFPYVDLFLFDIKHTDKEILKVQTGADATIVLDNLRYIAASNPEKAVIRIPIIPGFNNATEDIERIFRFTLEQKVKKIHLLPYHTLGKIKYEQMGRIYPFPYSDTMLPKEILTPLKNMGEEMNLDVQILQFP